MNIAENIKKIRLQNQLTQQQFADKIGISRHSLLNYEKGNRVPPMEIVMKISKTFEVDLDRLSTGQMVDDSFSISKDEYNLLNKAGLVSDHINITDISFNLEEFKNFLKTNGYPLNMLSEMDIEKMYERTLYLLDFEFFKKGYVKIG